MFLFCLLHYDPNDGVSVDQNRTSEEETQITADLKRKKNNDKIKYTVTVSVVTLILWEIEKIISNILKR